MMGMMGMPGMGMMGMMGGMDLNDIEFDAYLANDRTLADPEIVKVEKSGKVRLRREHRRLRAVHPQSGSSSRAMPVAADRRRAAG